MLLLFILAAMQIPAGLHSNQPLYTDISGSVLLLGDHELSNKPGSGWNVLSTDDDLFWKECSPGLDQRVMSLENGEIFSRTFFSGPYASGDNLIVSIPGEILILDRLGNFQFSYPVEEYPGSLCSDGEMIWFVSASRGVLIALDMSTSTMSPVELSFIPSTVSYRNGNLLIGNAEGGYSIATLDGIEVRSLPSGFCAYFSGDNTVTYTRENGSDGSETLSWVTVTVSILTGNELVSHLVPDNLPLISKFPDDDPLAHFDVPYMHQKWDTPDWFNGSWSCGPTSCMMAVQYYNRLTADSIWCSYPNGHWSEWGNYIPTEYTFSGYTYDITGESPGNVWVPGSHGFICRSYGGAGWNEMTWWMDQHGLDSSWLGTTWSALTNELDSSYPVIASSTSPLTGGHILLFNGYYDDHSVICNDSYGNQNLPGWGSLPNGKDVVYDWPGYNNGNTQLGVSQLFSARSEVLSPAGELIDDRTLGFRKLGPCQYWHEQETGYNSYSWWTYSTGAPPDTCSVEWIPDLSTEGWYLIESYIPSSHATATGIYQINTTTGWETATINQGSYTDEWATIGTFLLAPSSAVVKMGDYTGTQGQYISFDAIRFTEQTSIEEENYSSESPLFSLTENPVCSGSPLIFNLPENFIESIQIFDISGRLVLTVQSQVQTELLAPGLYNALLKHEDGYESIRFTVIR